MTYCGLKQSYNNPSAAQAFVSLIPVTEELDDSWKHHCKADISIHSGQLENKNHLNGKGLLKDGE